MYPKEVGAADPALWSMPMVWRPAAHPHIDEYWELGMKDVLTKETTSHSCAALAACRVSRSHIGRSTAAVRKYPLLVFPHSNPESRDVVAHQLITWLFR